MGIYIKGMEVPVFEHQSWDICKGTDGKWYVVDTNAETSDGEWHEIVPVPPHGRLKDADALSHCSKKCYGCPYDSCMLPNIVEDAPTIIPAEEGE